MGDSLKDDYRAALLALAEAFAAFKIATSNDAVLVGGAAVTILTAGRFRSGDFDFVASPDDAMAHCMAQAGFLREDRIGRLKVGWYHPAHPAFGFQQVTGPLFDGRADRDRRFAVLLRPGLHISLPSVEDMIADRLAQHAVASPTDSSRLDQARAMFKMAESPDMSYLARRVVEEGGDPLLLQEPAAGRT